MNRNKCVINTEGEKGNQTLWKYDQQVFRNPIRHNTWHYYTGVVE